MIIKTIPYNGKFKQNLPIKSSLFLQITDIKIFLKNFKDKASICDPSDLRQSTKCLDHHITTALSQPQVARHFNDRTLPSFTFLVFLWCTKVKSCTNHGWIKFLHQDINNGLFILLHKLCALWRKITQYHGTVIKETLPITHLFYLIGIFKKWQHCWLVITFPSISSIDNLSSLWRLENLRFFIQIICWAP